MQDDYGRTQINDQYNDVKDLPKGPAQNGLGRLPRTEQMTHTLV